MKKKNGKNQRRFRGLIRLPKIFSLPEGTKKWILGIAIFILAIIITLSFFDLAGVAGRAVMKSLTFLIGNTVAIIPFIFVLVGLVFFNTKYESFIGPSITAIFILIIGISGILEILNPNKNNGGLIGKTLSWPVFKFFSPLVGEVVFGGVILTGCLILWHLAGVSGLFEGFKQEKKAAEQSPNGEAKQSLIQKIFIPNFKVKEVEPKLKEAPVRPESALSDFKLKDISGSAKAFKGEYKAPPLDLLETDKGKPTAGDTITNSAIIKKTLENFGLGVEMSEINIGPTVTQYTLKPAEGIKLSKITALSNNLSLALASHPLRIEAPIPGKSLVGIEVPNKERCKVRLRDLLADPYFQNSPSSLTIALGRDVAGAPCYADLTRMPHLLVAGSTGTGKTIFLNSLIVALLYQNSPDTLRLILIDPKRVEFGAYKELPHLLAPVIFDAQRSINALKWLVSEMERRFEVLSGNGSRDIVSYNSKSLKKGEEPLPYIVLIIDELADLMAARGRDIEAGIVRLAQMARAVGIHLVVATQRPSVEVITGLIKANITSRVTFQVASQVDSRTVLDAAGAEKLIGYGDMLFISAEVVKPKRIQGAYVSEKELKRVMDYTVSKNADLYHGFGPKVQLEEGENHLASDLAQTLENENSFEDFDPDEDALYEEAKRVVIESKKASASLLQRRLRVGYARAARLLDNLEQNGVVGPGEGAKPREVFIKQDNPLDQLSQKPEEGDDWQKV